MVNIFNSAEDKHLAELLRQATQHRSSGDWTAAIATLAQAKILMLASPVAYSIETWLRYPLYLQHAGLFEESFKEFQFLMDDLEPRARRYSHLDNHDVGSKANKLKFYKLILKTEKPKIKARLRHLLHVESINYRECDVFQHLKSLRNNALPEDEIPGTS